MYSNVVLGASRDIRCKNKDIESWNGGLMCRRDVLGVWNGDLRCENNDIESWSDRLRCRNNVLGARESDLRCKTMI